MAEFFRMLNGAANQLDESLYEFYQIDRFANITRSLGSWGGIPNYRNIINTFTNCENCYVFADYMMHSFAYAIRCIRINEQTIRFISFAGKVQGHSEFIY